MKTRNLFIPLMLGSLFIPTNLDAVVFDLDIFENNQKRDHLTYEGGGGSGYDQTPASKRKKCAKRALRAIQFFEKKLADGEYEGESTEEIKNKIEQYKNRLSRCYPDKTDAEMIKQAEKRKKAEEIRSRKNIINSGYSGVLVNIRKNVLKQKNKINKENYPTGYSKDFLKRLDEKMTKLKFLEIMLNVIDELEVVKNTPNPMKNKKWESFYNEIYLPYQRLQAGLPKTFYSELFPDMTYLKIQVMLEGRSDGEDLEQDFPINGFN